MTDGEHSVKLSLPLLLVLTKSLIFATSGVVAVSEANGNTYIFFNGLVTSR